MRVCVYACVCVCTCVCAPCNALPNTRAIVDCWDGDDGEPVVTHGHTMVNKVKFVDCMKTVKEFGFETSVYPSLPTCLPPPPPSPVGFVDSQFWLRPTLYC